MTTVMPEYKVIDTAWPMRTGDRPCHVFTLYYYTYLLLITHRCCLLSDQMRSPPVMDIFVKCIVPGSVWPHRMCTIASRKRRIINIWLLAHSPANEWRRTGGAASYANEINLPVLANSHKVKVEQIVAKVPQKMSLGIYFSEHNTLCSGCCCRQLGLPTINYNK